MLEPRAQVFANVREMLVPHAQPFNAEINVGRGAVIMHFPLGGYDAVMNRFGDFVGLRVTVLPDDRIGAEVEVNLGRRAEGMSLDQAMAAAVLLGLVTNLGHKVEAKFAHVRSE